MALQHAINEAANTMVDAFVNERMKFMDNGQSNLIEVAYAPNKQIIIPVKLRATPPSSSRFKVWDH